MDLVSCLESQKNAAPRLVVFLTENLIDCQAFVVADQNLNIEVPDPTPEKSILCLIATYYAWHQLYPAAYKNVLEFFAFKVFKFKVKNNYCLNKFLRSTDNQKQKIEETQRLEEEFLPENENEEDDQ